VVSDETTRSGHQDPCHATLSSFGL
jgi:hypothetical protein